MVIISEWRLLHINMIFFSSKFIWLEKKKHFSFFPPSHAVWDSQMLFFFKCPFTHPSFNSIHPLRQSHLWPWENQPSYMVSARHTKSCNNLSVKMCSIFSQWTWPTVKKSTWTGIHNGGITLNRKIEFWGKTNKTNKQTNKQNVHTNKQNHKHNPNGSHFEYWCPQEMEEINAEQLCL